MGRRQPIAQHRPTPRWAIMRLTHVTWALHCQVRGLGQRLGMGLGQRLGAGLGQRLGMGLEL